MEMDCVGAHSSVSKQMIIFLLLRSKEVIATSLFFHPCPSKSMSNTQLVVPIAALKLHLMSIEESLYHSYLLKDSRITK